MKQILIQLFFVFLLVGCNERKPSKNNKSTTFDLIDMSIKQETGIYSLKISDLGKTYICFDELRRHSIYYTFNVGEKEIDSINYLVRQIKQIKIDTLYKAHCEDCSSYRIIIKSNDFIIKTMVENSDNSITSLKYMNKLVSYLSYIARTSKNELEMNFKFESKTSEFYPKQFIPPPRE